MKRTCEFQHLLHENVGKDLASNPEKQGIVNNSHGSTRVLLSTTYSPPSLAIEGDYDQFANFLEREGGG